MKARAASLAIWLAAWLAAGPTAGWGATTAADSARRLHVQGQTQDAGLAAKRQQRENAALRNELRGQADFKVEDRLERTLRQGEARERQMRRERLRLETERR